MAMVKKVAMFRNEERRVLRGITGCFSLGHLSEVFADFARGLSLLFEHHFQSFGRRFAEFFRCSRREREEMEGNALHPILLLETDGDHAANPLFASSPFLLSCGRS